MNIFAQIILDSKWKYGAVTSDVITIIKICNPMFIFSNCMDATRKNQLRDILDISF